MFHHPRHQNSFALVSTLLVLALLTLITTLFLQSVRVEGLTALACLNKTKALFVVEAGTADGVARLVQSDPLALVNGYERIPTTRGCTIPCLVAYELDGNATHIAKRHYLCSSPGLHCPPGSDPGFESVDINSRGLIGLTGNSGWQPVTADWIYLRDEQGTVVGRYAYWIDDESAKLNLHCAGAVLDPQALSLNGSTNRKIGAHPDEAALNSLFPDLNLELLCGFVLSRKANPDCLPTLSTAAQWLGPAVTGARFESFRASVTLDSKADERGATGLRRINLNDYVATACDVTTAGGRNALVKNVVMLGDYIQTALPGFGTRYYTGAVTPDDQRLYCIKLAANIQDYIDADHQPTVINQDLATWQDPPDPNALNAGAPARPPAVFGKELTPAIGEYLGSYYNEDGALRIDHTFEVWNLHSSAIPLNPIGQARILLAARPSLQPQKGSTAPIPKIPGTAGQPPLILELPKNTLIEAGHYALLTTLPANSPHAAHYRVGRPQIIPLARAEPSYAYGNKGLQMQGSTLASLDDANMQICVFNEYGYLDIEARVAQQGPIDFSPNDTFFIASQSFGNDPSSSSLNALRGYPLDSGDPRSFTEVFPEYTESGGTPSCIAWRRNAANVSGATNPTRLGGDSKGSTYGIRIDNNVTSKKYFVPEPCFVPDMSSPLDAISVIRNRPMKTIGELGFIYDPAISGPGCTRGTRNRGGFRTLSIGSPYGESAGPNRLTQVTEQTRASRLLEIFEASSNHEGSVLLNSVLRDDPNHAWRALLHNFKTQSNDEADDEYAAPRDPSFASGSLIDADALIQALRERLSDSARGPLLTLGQLADLPLFGQGDSLVAGQNLSPNAHHNDRLDRGREEVFRHLVGLLTLKGTVYTIYAVGQSGVMQHEKFTPLATQRLTQTVELSREYPSSPPQNTTELLQANRPVKFSWKILHRETDL